MTASNVSITKIFFSLCRFFYCPDHSLLARLLHFLDNIVDLFKKQEILELVVIFAATQFLALFESIKCLPEQLLVTQRLQHPQLQCVLHVFLIIKLIFISNGGINFRASDIDSNF